jgi:NADH:ubiquinone oxidoreductase subunit K
MITLSLLILISGIIFHRQNFLVICMILELIYLLLGLLLISFEMDFFVLIILGLTGCETAVGLSIILGYYLRTTKINYH